MTKIAFVGLGSMGEPLARHIASGPFELAVFDPFPQALQAFDGLARLAGSPADVASGVDIACICVRDDKQVRDVLFGSNGLAEGLKEGALVLIHSTISVAALNEIATQLANRKIRLIDAPVSRTRQTTDGPFVYTMMGGDEADVALAKPVVDCFSTDSSRMGPLGAGMATKICNNMVTWVQMIIGLQSTSLALRSGVEIDQLMTVMKSNGNLTPSMGAIIGGKFIAPPDPARDELLASQGGIGEKDLQLALDMAEAQGIDTRMIVQAQQLVRGLMAEPAQ